MSGYNPNNSCVFIAALVGYNAGLIAARSQPTNPNESDYYDGAARANFFAQAIDTVWGTASYTNADLQQIQSAATSLLAGGQSPVPGAAGLTAAGYTGIASALIAGVQAGTRQIVVEGVSPNGCSAGGGGGLNPPVNDSWAEPGWFIDPQNVTGKASDANDGLTVATPLLTYRQLTNLWTAISPILSQPIVTVKFLSSQEDASDPVYAHPRFVDQPGGWLVFTADYTIVHSGTLTVTQTQNYAAGHLYQVQLGTSAAPYVGMMLLDTTTGGWSFIRQDLGGGVAQVQQPVLPSGGVAGVGSAPTLTTITTGDHYQILVPVQVNFVELIPHVGQFNPADGYINGILVQNITSFCPDGVPSDSNLTVGCNVHFQDCIIEPTSTAAYPNSAAFANFLQNVWQQGGFFGMVGWRSIAGEVNLFMNCLPSDNHVDGNIICSDPAEAELGLLRQSEMEVGWVYLDTGVIFKVFSGFDQSFYGNTPLALVWGPGTFDVENGGWYIHNPPDTYAGTFLNAGGITIGGGTTAANYNQASGAWSGTTIAITPAHLDAAIGSSGFGGSAYVPQAAFATLTNVGFDS
jgi:hypothetical protein